MKRSNVELASSIAVTGAAIAFGVFLQHRFHASRYATDDLVTAITRSDIDRVRQLVSNGVSLNGRNAFGVSPLACAIRPIAITSDPNVRACNILRYLLDHDLNVASNSEDGDIAWQAAAVAGHTRMLDKQLADGVLIDRPFTVQFMANGGDALFWAAARSQAETVEMLLAKGANPNARAAITKSTPLIQAAAATKASKRMVALLLRRGALVNARNGDGCSALWWAARRGNVEAAQVLVDHGADIDDPSADGTTPLHMAIESHSAVITSLLVRAGAYVNVAARDGSTPLSRAISYSRIAGKGDYSRIIAILRSAAIRPLRHAPATNTARAQPVRVSAFAFVRLHGQSSPPAAGPVP